MDKWDGYVAARQRLPAAARDEGAEPDRAIRDVHQHYGADLKMDFTDPRSATVGVEFVNSAISTTGDESEVGTTWRRRADPHQVPQQPPRLRRLYATPNEMRADFRILEKVSVADLPIRTGGSLVDAGRPGSNTD